MSPHPEATAEPKRRPRVVIIGSGFGGLNAAKKLKRADVDIKLIARTTHHLFQPLLYQVATGIISEGEIAPPTRVVLRNQRNVQVLLGNVPTSIWPTSALSRSCLATAMTPRTTA
jgi:NADH:ubiquinone reductase (H+-translocating)